MNENDYKRAKEYAELDKYDESKANLSGADLSGDDLSGMNLFRVDLSKANLVGANLFNANLSHANLIEANLSNADLSYTNLSKANLQNANLSNADLSHANLSVDEYEHSFPELLGFVEKPVGEGLRERDALDESVRGVGFEVLWHVNQPFVHQKEYGISSIQ